MPAHAYKAAERRWAERESNRGAIVFQEVVSQLPPMLLGVQPGDAVLDMCASPGNKSVQLAERLGSSPGVLVAADVDPTRCTKVLGHSLKMACFPGSMVLLANARDHPGLLESTGPARAEPGAKPELCELKYDRVLADVPCTGDGTCRKDPGILRETWSRSAALKLHRRQVEILLRGLSLLRTGGTLVYSTCSLNPVENEAVVAAALAECVPGAEPEGSPGHSDLDLTVVELADAVELSQQLVGLKASPGLATWLVPEPKALGALYARWEDVPPCLQDVHGLTRSMFPPSHGGLAALLGRCARFFPHVNDTGGFFVAVMKKKRQFCVPSPLSGRIHGQGGVSQVEGDVDARLGRERATGRPDGWEPRQQIGAWFERAVEADSEWHALAGFYGLADEARAALAAGTLFWQVSFPSLERRRLCLVSAAAARRYEAELGSGLPARALPWFRLGVCLFERLRESFLMDTRTKDGCSLTPCRWRPCDEGAALLASKGWLRRRRLLLNSADLGKLLSCNAAMQQIALGDVAGSCHGLSEECSADLPASGGRGCGPANADKDEALERAKNVVEERRHECGGVLVSAAGDGVGSPGHHEGTAWLPGVLTPRQLRIFVERQEAQALAELLAGTYETRECT